MRGKSFLLAGMALALASGSSAIGFDETPVRYNPTPMLPHKPKGRLFIIEGVEIYALNKKNAIRKYNKLVK